MTANELADELDSISYDCTIEEWRASPVGNAAAMLRQQQAEIEALNRELLRYKSNGEMGYANELYKLGI